MTTRSMSESSQRLRSPMLTIAQATKKLLTNGQKKDATYHFTRAILSLMGRAGRAAQVAVTVTGSCLSTASAVPS